jgi:hypothetical protein
VLTNCTHLIIATMIGHLCDLGKVRNCAPPHCSDENMNKMLDLKTVVCVHFGAQQYHSYINVGAKQI